MQTPLVAGQTIATDYTLLHPLQGGDSVAEASSWLAIQESTQERVQLDILPSLTPEDVSQLLRSLDRVKPLIHPNILNSYALLEHNDDHIIVSEYRRGLATLKASHGPDATASKSSSQTIEHLIHQLEPALSALEYAHSLGFAHGAITADQIKGSDDGTVYLCGFGVAPRGTSEYLAPEAKQMPQVNPTPAADIYAIAQYLYQSATGHFWSTSDDDAQTNSMQLSLEVKLELSAMLSSNPMDRPTNFESLFSAVEQSQDQMVLEPGEFSKAQVSASPQPSDKSLNNAETSLHRLPRDRQVVSMTSVAVSMGVIIILGIGLFFILPKISPDVHISNGQEDQTTAVPTIETGEDAPTEPDVAETKTLAPLELAQLEELKKRGAVLASELLRRQVEVEDVGGRLWAGPRYDDAVNLGIEGDEAYREAQFQLAVDKYTAGVELLGDVLDETDIIFDETLRLGEQALLEGDAEQALNAYQILTKIEPQDTELARGLKRARNLNEVVNLTRDGEVLERNGDLDGALNKFRQANNLDEIWLAAEQGLNRINNQLARRSFQQEMSKGFEALATQDFGAARTAFEAAQRILPDSSEPLDGLQQIELSKRQANIQSLQEQAQTLAQEKDWNAVIPVYEQILTITPGLVTASAALKQAQINAELTKKLELYIEQPQLMQSDEGLNQARSALVEAATSEADFTDSARQLSHLVSLARLEVNVILSSDGKTDVTVYQVGRYGALDSTEFNLIPGVYTFVGKRSGFRDVYQEVHIKGDINPVKIDIRCDERI